jgi:hypothetical protein
MLSTFFVVTPAWGWIGIDTRLSDCGGQWCWLLVTAMLRRIGAATKCVQLNTSYSVTPHVCGLLTIACISTVCMQGMEPGSQHGVWWCVYIAVVHVLSKPATVYQFNCCKP